MKVVIFGATGGIGKWALQHALDKGYEVTVFVRNPQKVKIQHEHLTLFKGDLANREDYLQALTNQDAVIWCVGMPLQGMPAGFTTVNAHQYLIEAMQQNGVKRVIDWATPSLRSPEDRWAICTAIAFMAGQTFIRKGHNEFVVYSKMYQESDLDWTIVRFNMPTNDPYNPDYQVGFGEKRMALAISRENLGRFMVEQVKSKEYLCRMPIIGS